MPCPSPQPRAPLGERDAHPSARRGARQVSKSAPDRSPGSCGSGRRARLSCPPAVLPHRGRQRTLSSSSSPSPSTSSSSSSSPMAPSSSPSPTPPEFPLFFQCTVKDELHALPAELPAGAPLWGAGPGACEHPGPKRLTRRRMQQKHEAQMLYTLYRCASLAPTPPEFPHSLPVGRPLT